jgi:hypothetical protein
LTISNPPLKQKERKTYSLHDYSIEMQIQKEEEANEFHVPNMNFISFEITEQFVHQQLKQHN